MKDSRRDVERLRAALDRATPSDPGADARVAQVVSRARRQRARGGARAVLAVAACAAVVVITPQVLTSLRTENVGTTPPAGQPTSAAQHSVDPFATTPCPAVPYELGTAAADQETTDEIRGDAQSVRLCAASIEGTPDVQWVPPRDALELGLDAGFLNATRELPEADPDRCAAIRVAPDPYTFLVGYADGSVETVAVSNVCTDLAVDGRRIASGDVLTAFEEALAEQRQRLQPAPGEALGVDCLGLEAPGPSPLVLLTRGVRVDEDTSFTGFVVCERDGPVESGGGAVQLLNEEWPASIRDMSEQDALEVDRCPVADVDVGSSVGVTSWGDVISFAFGRCGSYYLVTGYIDRDAAAPGAGAVQFLPSEKLADALHLP